MNVNFRCRSCELSIFKMIFPCNESHEGTEGTATKGNWTNNRLQQWPRAFFTKLFWGDSLQTWVVFKGWVQKYISLFSTYFILFFPFRTLFWFRREISNTSIKINMAAEKMIGSLCVESFFQVSEAQSTWPREEEEVAVWCSKVGFFDIFALCTPSNWWEKRGEKTWWNVNMNLWICFLF